MIYVPPDNFKAPGESELVFRYEDNQYAEFNDEKE